MHGRRYHIRSFSAWELLRGGVEKIPSRYLIIVNCRLESVQVEPNEGSRRVQAREEKSRGAGGKIRQKLRVAEKFSRIDVNLCYCSAAEFIYDKVRPICTESFQPGIIATIKG